MYKLISKTRLPLPRFVTPPPPPVICHRGVLRLCAAIALSLFVVGVAYGQHTVPNPSVCERTPQISQVITRQVRDATGNAELLCNNVTVAQLAAITSLELGGRFPNLVHTDVATTTLQTGDFAGLAGLNTLNLSSNDSLLTLPAGIFDGIPVAASINMNNTPLSEGLPLALVDDLKSRDDAGADIETDLLRVQGVLSTPLELVIDEVVVLDLEDVFIEFSGGYSPAGEYTITEVNPGAAMASQVINHRITIKSLRTMKKAEIRVLGISVNDDTVSATHTIEIIPDPTVYPDPLVCDRTSQVRTGILAVVSVASCGQVTLAHLADILIFAVVGATKLKAGDFNNLPKLGSINLNTLGNNLQTLPAGMFEGVPSNTVLNLNNNPFSEGLPSELIDRFKSRSGNVTIDLVAVNDILPTALSVPVGSTENLDLTDAFFRIINRSFESASNYEITVADPEVATTQISGHTLTITALAEGQTEIEVAGILGDQLAMQTLTIAVPLAGLSVCERTQEVQDEIVSLVRTAQGDSSIACGDITSAHLAAIESLALNSRDIAELRVGDFGGLTGFTAGSGGDDGLNLTTNDLQTLPVGIFDDIPQHTAIKLVDNPFGKGLPLALVNDLKSRADAGAFIAADFVTVQDVLPARLSLLSGETEDLDLEDAFVIFSAGYHSARSGNYIITSSTPTVATATEVVGHETTITAVGEGETEIQIIGVHPFSTLSSLTNTLTVAVEDKEVTATFVGASVSVVEDMSVMRMLTLSEAAPEGGVTAVLTVASEGDTETTQIGLSNTQGGQLATSITVVVNEGEQTASFYVGAMVGAAEESPYQIEITSAYDEESNGVKVVIGTPNILTVRATDGTIPNNLIFRIKVFLEGAQ